MSQDEKLQDTLPDVKKSSVLTKCALSNNNINYLIIAAGIGVMLIVGVILLMKYIGLKNQLEKCQSVS